MSNKFVPDSFTFLDWRKATEKKLREQIAQEIEDTGCICTDKAQCQSCLHAAIARGERV